MSPTERRRDEKLSQAIEGIMNEENGEQSDFMIDLSKIVKPESNINTSKGSLHPFNMPEEALNYPPIPRTTDPVNLQLKPLNIKNLAERKGDDISVEMGMLDPRFAYDEGTQDDATGELGSGNELGYGNRWIQPNIDFYIRI